MTSSEGAHWPMKFASCFRPASMSAAEAAIEPTASARYATDGTFAVFNPQNLGLRVSPTTRIKNNDRIYVKVIRAAGGALIANEPMTSLPPMSSCSRRERS